MPGVADQVGYVLVQGAAAADVQYLHAAADGEQRYAEPQGMAGDGEIPRVPQRYGGLRLRVPGRAVPDRVDVRPARYDQAVKAASIVAATQPDWRLLAHLPNPYPYDPAKAKALLLQAGAQP